MPNIACGKQPRHAGLKIVRRTLQWPVLRVSAVSRQIRTGDEIAGGVARDADLLGPFRVRYAAETQEEPFGIERLLLRGFVVRQRDTTQGLFPMQSSDLRMR